jgi:Zn-dependent alcohol dehydrogenase
MRDELTNECIQLSQFLQGLRSIVGCVEGNDSPQKLVPLLAKMYSEGKVSEDPERPLYPNVS